MIPISFIILTFDSEETIGATLQSVMPVSDDVHVVDSYSTDKTLEIARDAGAQIVQHPFEHYGAQRNWAIDNVPLKYEWELHLDADERLTEALAQALSQIELTGSIDGYFIPRLVHFLGRPIKHGAMYPKWHMRLFRRGKGRCEMRYYDQHFYVTGRTAEIPYPFIDDIRMPLREWTARHNAWADAEAMQILASSDVSEDQNTIHGKIDGNPIERQRSKRAKYQKLPLFVRPFLLFLYRYVFRLGFLDGREGLIFFTLQTFWFRFLVDAKIYEHKLHHSKIQHASETRLR